MRKGVTPVVAVVLLIGITVSGSMTVYQIFAESQSTAQQYQPDIQLSSNSLDVESCWGTESNPKLMIRSNTQETFNASKIPVRVNRTLLDHSDGDYTIDDPIVDPQESFEISITISEPITEKATISLLTTQESVTYQCLNLD